jgi:putative endonuclease
MTGSRKLENVPQEKTKHTTQMQYFTYILASKRNGTFYTGVTNDLIRRVFEHKEGVVAGFTKKYEVKMLVYYEIYEDVRDAIVREKLIKKWRREIKMAVIERMNPDWKDLYFEL